METSFYENYKSLCDLEKSFTAPASLTFREHRLYMPTRPEFPPHGDAAQKVNESFRLLCANAGVKKADEMLEKAFLRYGINEEWLKLTRGVLYSTDGCDFTQNPYLKWKHSGDQQPKLKRVE